MNLAALVVSFNSADELQACLDALSAFAGELEAGVLVVDNASTDESVALVRRRSGVRLIANADNLGFAGAVNQGFHALPHADAVLLLNPDAHIASPPSMLAAELAHPQVGAASGRLVSQGSAQVGFQVRRFPTPAALAFEVLGVNRLWPANPVNRRWRALDLDPGQPADVEQPAGACLLIRRKAWEQLGGFDQGFHPLWFEDVDFLRRASIAGWRVRYNPYFLALHHGGRSVAKVSWPRRQLYWYGSLLRYAARHFSPWGRRWVCCAVIFGLVPRLVMGIISGRSSQAVGVCGRLMRLAFSYLSRGAFGEEPRRAIPRAAVEDCGPSGS